jgi:hypothetical protein
MNPELVPAAVNQQRYLARLFQNSARLKDSNPQAPFIEWPDLNQHPYGPDQLWTKGPSPALAQAVGEITYQLFFGRIDCIISAPRSASMLWQVIKDEGRIPNIAYPHILKQEQLNGWGEDFEKFPIPSYTQNKQADGSRGMVDMFFEPAGYAGKSVLLLEDALAEGRVTGSMSEILKRHFNAAELHILVVMSKGLIEGGTEHLNSHPDVDSLVEIVTVSDVRDGIQLAPLWQ